MEIYDITQEVFSCEVYPSDPIPKKEVLSSMEKGDLYNLTAFSMCAHNGTHIDSPYHFVKEGKTIDEIPLEKCVGECYVAEHSGVLTKEDAKEILKKAGDSNKRILIKGKAIVSEKAAEVFAESGVYLLGNESQTVGPFDAPMEVHLKLLKKDVVLLEGIRLGGVCEGTYFLFAAPLKLEGADGSPVRAVLLKF